MNKHLLAAALVAALALPGAVAAATIVAPGTSQDSVNKSLTVGTGTVVKDVETVNGSIEVESRSGAEEVETVNGSIDVGDDVSVESLATVNGSIRAGSGLKVSADVETVNGRIEIGAGSAIQGSVSTVNGRVQLEQSSVARNVETVNGGLSFDNARIGGNVELVNGRADVLAGTIVAGDLIVRKSKGNWGWGQKSKPPVVVIGAGSEVGGRIIIENEEAKVYIHESARVGAVEGVQPTRYSGSSAPE
jgi:DUF4097 and DUF4098 domain-containing protein YvlB